MSDNISRGLQAAAVNSLPFDNRDVENLSIAPPQKTKVKLEASESMPPSNEEKDGDVAPAQTPTLVKGGAKVKKAPKRHWNIKSVRAKEASKHTVPTTDLLVGIHEIGGRPFPVVIKPAKLFPGRMDDDKDQRAWDRLSCAQETAKSLFDTADKLEIKLDTHTPVAKLLSDNMATWLGNDSKIENVQVLHDNISNAKHPQAQFCKKYLTGQALLDALRDLRLQSGHVELKSLTKEDREFVLSWEGNEKKRKSEATDPKPAKKAQKLTVATKSASPYSAREMGAPASRTFTRPAQVVRSQAAVADGIQNQQQASGFDAQRLLQLLTQPHVDIKNVAAADMAGYLQDSASLEQAIIRLRGALNPTQYLPSADALTPQTSSVIVPTPNSYAREVRELEENLALYAPLTNLPTTSAYKQPHPVRRSTGGANQQSQTHRSKGDTGGGDVDTDMEEDDA